MTLLHKPLVRTLRSLKRGVTMVRAFSSSSAPSSSPALLSSISGAGSTGELDFSAKLWIDNELVDAEGGRTIAVRSPADDKVFAELADGSASDVDAAVDSARRCFDGAEWSAPELVNRRAAVLRAMAADLRANKADIARVESLDCGKPLGEADGDIDFCADVCEYYADVAERVLGSGAVTAIGDHSNVEHPDGDADFLTQSGTEAVGVVGMITPWNFPLMQSVLKVAPALAAGCSMVLKPSPLASLSSVLLGAVAARAGAPPGALNVVTGGPGGDVQLAGAELGKADGVGAGPALSQHPGLDKLSFTGSGPVGSVLLRESSAHLRPTSLELGGKGSLVLFADALGVAGGEINEEALDAAVDWIMCGIFLCSGQVCSATSRLLVERPVLEAVATRLADRAKEIRVGNPLEEGTQMGPVVSFQQAEKVRAYISGAESEGLRILAGGSENPSRAKLGECYVDPTVLQLDETGKDTGATAWREEIFGPVLCVRGFDSEEEAISLANNSPYGLADAVFTADDGRWARMQRALKTGVVWRNCTQPLMPWTPFGGKAGRASGFGHELGEVGLREYLSEKTLISARKSGFSWEWYK